MSSSSKVPAPKMADKKTINLQLSSPFFHKFPQEVRDEVYRFVFSSTRLTFAEGIEGTLSEARRNCTLPSLNSLALLKTCHKIRAEIGDTWIRFVLFNFGSSGDMRKKLVGLPTDIISKIRYLRVCDIPHGYLYVDPAGRLAAVLSQLPGLKLDQLTILANDDFIRSYYTLGGMIAKTDGWKELRFICQDPRILMHETREAQPSHWKAVLNRRDGADTNPMVTLYRSTKPFFVGSVLCPETRETFEERLPGEYEEEDDDDKYDAQTAYLDAHREVLIVAKRGRGADYQQKKVTVKRGRHPLLGVLGFPMLALDSHDDDFVVYTDGSGLEAEEVVIKGDMMLHRDFYTHPEDYTWSHHDRRVYTNMF